MVYESFLKKLIIKKMVKLIKDKKESATYCGGGHLFMDHNLSPSREIVKLNEYFLWQKNNRHPDKVVWPINWYSLRGYELLSIYNKLNNNDFYYYEVIGNEIYKRDSHDNLKFN